MLPLEKMLTKCIECDKVARWKGLCDAHYSSQLRASHTELCTVDGCNKIGHTRKYCHAHYAKLLRHGDVNFKRKMPGKGTESPAWKDKPSYIGIHARVKRERGKANKYKCIDCGRQAQDWSLNMDCNYVFGESHGKLLPMSYDINDYEPRCKRCHGIYDGWIENLSWWHEYVDA